MGYDTDFRGSFAFNRTPPRELDNLLGKLVKVRHDDDQRWPSIYCQWKLDRDWNSREWVLIWDGGEKFYAYAEWLQLILDDIVEQNSLNDYPEGDVKLNGTVRWRGENFDDIGYLEVSDNVLTVHRGYWPPVMVIDDRPPSNYPLPLIR